MSRMCWVGGGGGCSREKTNLAPSPWILHSGSSSRSGFIFKLWGIKEKL